MLQDLLSTQYNQMRPKDTATRRKRGSEIQRCTKLESLQRHRHDEAKVLSKPAESKSPPDITARADPFATSETIGEVETYLNDFDQYFDDVEKGLRDWDPQSSSNATYSTDETSCWLEAKCSEQKTSDWLNEQSTNSRAIYLYRSSSYDDIFGSATRAPKMTSQLSSHQTDISVLIDRLSECSLGGKSFIRNNLEQFSAATTASKTISLRSKPSPNLCQTGESSEFRAPATSVLIEYLTQPLEAIGRIFSNGIFWYHMGREILRDPPSFRSAYCEGLCSSQSPYWFQTWEVGTPVPIDLQHARVLIQEIWSDRMPGWVDRFGNTSLHIAAACGPSFSQLLGLIIEYGDVNALNTAGQTFMHVLDPDSMSLEDMIALRDQLVLEGFMFHHRDVAGQMFLDTLKHSAIEHLDFAQCWLRPIIRKKDTIYADSEEITSEPMLDYRLVKKIFDEIGGHDEQWDMLGWAEPSYQYLHFSSTINELLEPSYRPMLLKNKDFSDRSGLGLLHFAADGIAGHSTPTEAQQQHFNALRLDLVKHLLSIGVDVNRHDDEGVTPLMAHMRCVPYQHAIVDQLLQYGADPNARKRTGETALHIAIKLGNIDATKALLGRGANVHARNRKCEGLLTVAERAQRHAKDDVSLYAKITACMALVIDAGAIASPNLFHEWSLPGWTSH